MEDTTSTHSKAGGDTDENSAAQKQKNMKKRNKELKRGLDKNHPILVQGTNDSSIVSKRSSARYGYYEDQFLRAFVKKPSRRSPLINRGYYIRTRAIDHVLLNFVEKTKGQKPQILSLGAGFDTTFFRQFVDADLRGYYEVDFPALVARKKILIFVDAELKSLAKLEEAEESNPREEIGGGLLGPIYKLIGCDLTELENLEKRLRAGGFDFSAPTIILSECVLTYVDTRNCNELLKWACKTVKESSFVTYEQVHPTDAFGTFMQGHFRKVGAELKAINAYPTPTAHCERLRGFGWPHADARDMLTFFNETLSEEERQRVSQLECFDEYEEWYLKCQHYVVVHAYREEKFQLWATKQPNISDPETITHLDKWQWKQQETKASKDHQRWGSGTAITGDGTVYSFGGYGGAKHIRLGDLVRLAPPHEEWTSVAPLSNVTPRARVHASLSALNDGRLILIGGRASPSAPMKDAFSYDTTRQSWSPETLPDQILLRWRHTATTIVGTNTVIVFGGKVSRSEVVGSGWSLNFDEKKAKATELVDGDVPPPRFSAASCFVDGKVLLFGGLASDSQPLSDCYALHNDTWSKVEMTPQLPPRFSHAMTDTPDGVLVIGSCGDRNLLWHQQFLLLDVTHNCWKYIDVSGSSDLYCDLLFVGHTLFYTTTDENRGKLLICHGGGNLFSFGTKFNKPHNILCDRGQETCTASVEPTDASLKTFQPSAVQATLASPFNLNTIQHIPGDIATTEKFWEITTQRTPVIFRGCKFTSTPWTSEFLQSCSSTKKVSVHICDDEGHMSFVRRNFRFDVMEFQELIPRVFSESPGKLYLRSMGENIRKDVANFDKSFPDLAATFSLPEFTPKELVNDARFSSSLRVSSKGTQLWTHFDIMDNVLCNIVGRKKVILWAPDQADNLYVDGTTSPIVDLDNVDLQKYPRFANSTSVTCTLEPGDMLFIPALWFHNVTPLEPCVSVNVFWRHLPANMYAPRDLYGSKDLPIGSDAMESIQALRNLPLYYRDFYLRRIISAAGDMLTATTGELVNKVNQSANLC